MIGPTWRLFDRVAAEYDDVVPFFAEYGTAIVAALAPPQNRSADEAGLYRASKPELQGERRALQYAGLLREAQDASRA